MRINATLPFDNTESPQEFLHMEAVAEIGQTLEAAGFSGANVTDHPCAPARWLDAGGHNPQDPFVMLSLVAAATRTLRLQTGILVVPYRSPFITARAAASLDVFSGGRLILGMGAGYLKGEFFALGAEFDQRNDLMDEYFLAMKAAWSGKNFSFAGSDYSARDCRLQPQPVQRPHPPLLVGGNSRRAIRRAAELADGWYPFFTPAALSATTRTASMSGEKDLVAGIDYLRAHCEKIGRQQLPEIFVGSIRQPGDTWDAQAILDKLARFRELGVNGCVTHVDGRTRAEWCDNARWLGAEVLAKIC